MLKFGPDFDTIFFLHDFDQLVILHKRSYFGKNPWVRCAFSNASHMARIESIASLQLQSE